MGLTRPKYSQIYDTDYKQSVKYATTTDVGNLIVNGSITNSVDGATVSVGDRILVKDQTDGRQNGIWEVVTAGTGSNGTWRRALDANDGTKVTSGMTTTIEAGSTNAYQSFKLTTADPITIGVTSLAFINPFSAGAVSGSTGSIQFSDAGINGSDFANLSFDKTTKTLSSNNININSGTAIIGANGAVIAASLKSPIIGNSGAQITGTIQTASQTNITTVGNLTSLSVGGTIQTTGIVYGNSGVSGTLLTAAQPNITSATGLTTIGNLTSLSSGGTIQTTGIVYANSGVASASTTSGALVVTGGLGVSGNIYANQGYVVGNITAGNLSATYLQGTLTTAAQPNITSVGNLTSLSASGTIQTTGIVYANSSVTSTSTTSGALQVRGGVGIVGNAVIGGILTAGQTLGANTTAFTNTIGAFTSTANSWTQLSTQNLSTDIGASTDIIAYAPNGDNNSGWIDIGITGQNFLNQSGQYGITGKNDGYIFMSAPSGTTNGGNLFISTDSTGTWNDIVFSTGGFNAGQEQARFKAGIGLKLIQGTPSTNTTSGALQVTGGVGIQGNLNVGGDIRLEGNIYLTGNAITFNSNNVSYTDSLIYLADDNSGDLLDIGFVGSFTTGSYPAGYQHTGFVRDATDGIWKLFANVVPEPTTTVNFTNATYKDLLLGNLSAISNVVVGGSTQSTGTGIGALVVTGGASVGANLSVGGNATISGTRLTLSGTGSRITGDFTNATPSLRTQFQSSTTNGSTFMVALPNGTATTSGWYARNSSDADNNGYISIQMSSTSATLVSDKLGTGSYVPMLFNTGGSERLRIDIGGNVQVAAGGTATAYSNLTVYHTTASSGTTSGALVVAGGAGIAGNVNAGNVIATYFTGTLLTAAQTNITSVGNVSSLSSSGTIQTIGLVYANSGVVSSSTTTGALQVTGGVGISNNLNVGLAANAATVNASTINVGQMNGVTIGNSGAVLYGTLNSSSASQTNVTTIGNLTTLDVTGRIRSIGQIQANSGIASTSTTTGALTVIGGVGITGALYATTKSFDIDHPLRPGTRLRHGSLEGPEFGVYVRGRLTNSLTIQLPDYWTKLVDPASITVTLTPIGYYQELYVSNINNNQVLIVNRLDPSVDCYYTVWAERADIDPLEVESN
jgi:hypothetical protein